MMVFQSMRVNSVANRDMAVFLYYCIEFYFVTKISNMVNKEVSTFLKFIKNNLPF